MFSLRILSRAGIAARPALRVASRPLHITARRQAAPIDNNLSDAQAEALKRMQENPELRELVMKVTKHPEAMAAMQKVGQLGQKLSGVWSAISMSRSNH